MSDIFELAKQFRRVQEELQKAQEELAKTIYDIANDEGTVKITISGHQRVQAIEINPELVDSGAASRLEQVLVEAVNKAIIESQKHAAERLEGLTGGLNLPGM